MPVTDDVRRACRVIAESAESVRLVPEALDHVTAGPVPEIDAEVHLVDAAPSDVASYFLTLDAINFGSGYFDELPGCGYEPVARALRSWWLDEGALDAAGLRRVDAGWVGELLDQPADHALIGLYADALNELGGWLGDRTALEVVRAAEPSAERLAATLADALPMWRDTGFLKRAQIAASDLALAGVARFDDLHRLTTFADNVLPQVLRVDGVLVLSDELAAVVDAGEVLPAGREERELRACALHACELIAARVGLTARELDNVLWTRGQDPEYASPPPHRTYSTFY